MPDSGPRSRVGRSPRRRSRLGSHAHAARQRRLIVATARVAFFPARGISRDTPRIATWLACISPTFYLTQLAFCLGYYGEGVPNTAHGKVSWNARRLASGWKYVSEGAPAFFGFLLPLVAGAVSPSHDTKLRKQLRFTLQPIQRFESRDSLVKRFAKRAQAR